MNRILIVRNDRMGDLVLTTPMFEAVKRSNAKAKVSALIAPANFELVRESPFVDEILLDDYDRSVGGLREMARDLGRREFDAAVIAVPSFRICLAVLMGRIPVRICPGTHAYTYLLCNHVLAQRRSRAEKNEAEYNLDLLSPLGLEPVAGLRPVVRVADDDREWAEQKLSLLGVDVKDRKLVAVHPGMGGSALNWSIGQWRELVRLMCADAGLQVLMTGTTADRRLVYEVTTGQAEDAAIHSLAGQTTVGQLLALLEQAHAFVGPSTGPMHAAAALGIPTMAIYSPVRVHCAKRWGPWNASRAHVFAPALPCPGHFRCLGRACDFFNCMDRIKPEDVYRHLKTTLG